MTLNPNSWHAKYYRKVVDNTLPDSLCTYMSQLIGYTLLALIGIVVIGGAFIAPLVSEGLKTGLLIYAIVISLVTALVLL